jgi:RNA polymerase sigma-70 factor (ECF subfamily)
LGSPTEFETLYRTHLGLVWRALRRFGVGEASLDDAAHEVFVSFHRHLEDIEPDRYPAWLYGASRRVAANWRRTQARAERKRDRELEPAALPTADALLRRSEAAQMVEAFLASLPEAQREAFVLVQIDGLKLREAAAVANVTVSTLNSRVRTAREAFREYLRRLHEDEVANG